MSPWYGKKSIVFLFALVASIVVTRVFFYSLTLFSVLPDHSERKLSLVIFKLPRTGSTWFTETLNRFQSVFIAKEIIQHSDVGIYPVKDVEAHLEKALQFPVDKLSAKDNVLFPSNQFVTNYYMTSKAFTRLSIVGISLNIEHCQGVRWNRVTEHVPQLHAVLLRRGNVIKQAVSGYRGRTLHKLCGVSNLRSGSAEDCARKLPKTIAWSLSDFATNVNQWQRRVYHFNRGAYKVGVPVLDIQYEEIQTNQSSVLHRMWSFLSLNDHVLDPLLQPSILASDTASSVTKRTSEDLSLVLDKFEEISAFLAHPSCACLREQLLATLATPVKEECYHLVNLADRRCDEFVDSEENKPDYSFFWGSEFTPVT
mmetsp:Transcript_23066/g.33773  ORF Transcript_23066/g.33773 Transcript_23066/m.33773 type:complete len:368 (+) Transcript_23066:61-1164(+)